MRHENHLVFSIQTGANRFSFSLRKTSIIRVLGNAFYENRRNGLVALALNLYRVIRD